MKFMKRKIAVVLLVLFACTGMAMAVESDSEYNRQKAYNQGFENGSNGDKNTCTSKHNNARVQKSCNDGYREGRKVYLGSDD